MKNNIFKYHFNVYQAIEGPMVAGELVITQQNFGHGHRFLYKASNGWTIYSIFNVEINAHNKHLYIKGSEQDVFHCSFVLTKAAFDEVTTALEEFKNHFCPPFCKGHLLTTIFKNER